MPRNRSGSMTLPFRCYSNDKLQCLTSLFQQVRRGQVASVHSEPTYFHGHIIWLTVCMLNIQTWWRHGMENLSALLAREWHRAVYTAHGWSIGQSFDDFVVVSLSKQLNMQPNCQWFKILWHWYDVTIIHRLKFNSEELSMEYYTADTYGLSLKCVIKACKHTLLLISFGVRMIRQNISSLVQG